MYKIDCPQCDASFSISQVAGGDVRRLLIEVAEQQALEAEALKRERERLDRSRSDSRSAHRALERDYERSVLKIREEADCRVRAVQQECERIVEAKEQQVIGMRREAAEYRQRLADELSRRWEDVLTATLQ